MLSTAHAWEATLLCRRAGGHSPVVAGRVEIQAPDVESARVAADAAVAARDDGTSIWSLGILRPLTLGAPGTHRYRVVFAIWESTDDRFVRSDVAEIEVEACDAQSARRQASQEIQHGADYRPAWRIREVVRTAPPARTPRRGRRAAPVSAPLAR